ncbi:hypothetical protein RRG49_02235 [Mycoplasmopsis felis]|uniref:hypothetical protein n=1 Tax=Mycoplasmopsis felis TaxID=33923 RepID=UPI0021AE5392|nr:hypothetical protein [Mycoplasmopsis felis]UWW00513.1 hypothetical protein NW064_04615 [Mycoplasmopsis felis]WAM02443.1 hypothetical protein ONA02_01025 [Mycoplasmopsis felis]WQQ09005.1 hypothetical protein RRG41_02625 [Mycoplasmopsis felis]
MKSLKLDYNKFIVSKKFNITYDDLHNLRQFYGIFLGTTAVCLYQYLIDLLNGSYESIVEFDFKTLALFLNVHEDELQIARKRLEGAGLLNTYKDNKKALTIFEIQKPISIEDLQKNAFLTNLIESKIGEINFKRLIDSRKLKLSSNYDNFNYEDITTDFFTMFQNVSKSYIKEMDKDIIKKSGSTYISDNEVKVYSKKQNLNIKLEIGNIQYSNEYEAIFKLSVQDFFKQITENNLSMSDLTLIDSWKSQIFDEKVLNLIIYISKQKYKTDRWKKSVSILIKEINSQNLVKFSEVETYLDGKLKMDRRYLHIFETKTVLKRSFESKVN